MYGRWADRQEVWRTFCALWVRKNRTSCRMAPRNGKKIPVGLDIV